MVENWAICHVLNPFALFFIVVIAYMGFSWKFNSFKSLTEASLPLISFVVVA